MWVTRSRLARWQAAISVFSAAALLIAAPVVFPPGASAGTVEKPWTVPALQEWTPGPTDYQLPPTVRIFVDRRYSTELSDDSQTFAEDLRALTGRHVVVDQVAPIEVSDSDPQHNGGPGSSGGAIRLTLDPGWTKYGPEANTIVVNESVTIWGPTDDGVFWGTRSLLQMLRQHTRLPGGTARDWPGYEQRSFMVDNGRKYFSPAWAKRQIRELSYLKYNQFHWHLTENQGFRIESKRYPDLMSPEYWSQNEVRELVAYAAKYHLEVIPEIDMPGHMQYALRNRRELQIVDRNGNPYGRNLDPTNPAAREFAKNLLDELIPLFPGRFVHTGGDEYAAGRSYDDFPALERWADERFGQTANAKDAVLDFTNFINQVVNAHGKTMRAWNDSAHGGSAVQADRNIVLEYWSSYWGPVPARELLDQGYQLVNANRDVLYDVPGSTATVQSVDPRKIYDSWDMTRWMPSVGPNTTAPREKGVLGGQIHVWMDTPSAATEEEVALRIQTSLRAHSQQLWDSPRLGSTWNTFYPVVFAAGREPQWELLDGPSQDVARGKPTWASAREPIYLTEASLTDGNNTTRWAGPRVDAQNLIIDLEDVVDVGTVTLRWETAFASSYDVQISDDLATWRTMYSTDSGDGGVDVLPVDGKGRYLRLMLARRGSGFGYSLWGMEVHPKGVLAPAAISGQLDPAIVVPEAGQTATSTLRLANVAADPVDVRWQADAPEGSGIGVSPAMGTLTVPGGGSGEASLEVTATNPGVFSVPIALSATSGGQSVDLGSLRLLVSVPHRSIAEAFNNVGVTNDDDIAPPGLGGGFDGAGSSYSAQALAGAGVTPGTSMTFQGVALNWPDVPPGQPNNVVANGQTIALAGSGQTLGILAASTYGPATGVWIVHYTDGTTQRATITEPDWTVAPPPGATVAVATSYRNLAGSGQVSRRSQVFFHPIPLDPTKTVAKVTLPIVSATAVQGRAALHVFALGIG